jgi:hypothetical protein
MFQDTNIALHRRNVSPRAAAPPVSEKKFKVEACCLKRPISAGILGMRSAAKRAAAGTRDRPPQV